MEIRTTHGRSFTCAPLLTTAFALLLSLAASAQTYQRILGGSSFDEGRAVLPTDDGGFLLTGATASFGAGANDMHLIRTNALGEVLWTRTYGGQFNEIGFRALAMPDGGFTVMGETDNSWGGLLDHYIVRVDATGELLWSRRIGGIGNDNGADIIATPDGGFLITGNSGTFGTRRLMVAKLSGTGELLWNTQVGGSSNDGGRAIAAAPGGGAIVAGYTDSFITTGRNLFMVRINDQGTVVWSRSIGNGGATQAFGITATPNGEWMITGRTTNGPGGVENVLLVRMSDSGDVLWAKSYGGPDGDSGNAVEAAENGGYLVAGLARGYQQATVRDAMLMRVDENGEVLWTRLYGGPASAEGFQDLARLENGYVAVGYASVQPFGFSTYLVRTDLEGTSGCDELDIVWTAVDAGLTVSSPTLLVSSLNIVGNDTPTEPGSGGSSLDVFCMNNTTGIYSHVNDVAAMRLMPNPANDHVQVEFDEIPAATDILHITNAMGQLVRSHRAQGRTHVLDVSDLPKGLYHVQFHDARGRTTQRLVVGH